MQIAKKEQQLVLVWYVWLGHMQMFIHEYILTAWSVSNAYWLYMDNVDNINTVSIGLRCMLSYQISDGGRKLYMLCCGTLCYVIFTCASEHVFTNPLPCLYILVSEWSQCVWSIWEVRDMTMWNVGHLSRVPSSPWVCMHIPEIEKVLTEACCSYMINRNETQQQIILMLIIGPTIRM